MNRIMTTKIIVKLLIILSTIVMQTTSFSSPTKQFYGGAGVGRFIMDDNVDAWKCKYDMVLVERLQGKPQAESGLFIPDEDLPRFHVGRVISMGPGREEENGMIAPMPNVKVGDIVICKNPWGIGPKDEETADGKKLSFMRGQDIAAVLKGTIVDSD